MDFLQPVSTIVMFRKKNTPYKVSIKINRDADKSLDRPGRKQATATEDFDFHNPI
jgi:hypothetical protein